MKLDGSGRKKTNGKKGKAFEISYISLYIWPMTFCFRDASVMLS